MSEPHQRVQSGKLRSTIKSRNSDLEQKSSKDLLDISVGVESSDVLDNKDSDDIYECFMQGPAILTWTSIQILTKLAKDAYKIDSPNSVDPYWRNTWNIGTWNVGNQVSVSFNAMQPNIAQSWITIHCSHDDRIEDIATRYNDIHLPKCTCRAVRISTGYQLQGRWSITLLDELISTGYVSRNNAEFGGFNITGSTPFAWVLIGENSEYLCTLTQDSTRLLMKYIPEWCQDLLETSAAGQISLRAKNSMKVNDFSQLTINTLGGLQYNGREHNIPKLYGAFNTSIQSIMKSIHLKPFLESMHFQKLSENF